MARRNVIRSDCPTRPPVKNERPTYSAIPSALRARFIPSAVFPSMRPLAMSRVAQ